MSFGKDNNDMLSLINGYVKRDFDALSDHNIMSSPFLAVRIFIVCVCELLCFLWCY